MYADMIEEKKVCNGCNWDVSLYEQLGTSYAWIHTGVAEHMANGTTLTMSKKGSGLPALINPCIQQVLRSEAYVEMCSKYHLLSQCFENEYSPANVEKPYVPPNASSTLVHASSTPHFRRLPAPCPPRAVVAGGLLTPFGEPLPL